MDDADIRLGNSGFLGKLGAQEALGNGQVAVEEPAHQSEGKHVAALQHGLVVHARVGEAVLHHLRDGRCDNILLNAHFGNGVVGLEGSLLKVSLLETVRIDDDASRRLGKLVLRLEGGSVHRYQHVAQVAWGKHLAGSDVNLEAAHACQRALRGADVGGIIRERADVVSDGSRDGGEEVSSQLHAVAGVAREAHYHLLQFFYNDFFTHSLYL